MADLTITAANVVQGADAVTTTGLAGEAITAGQAVYRSSTTNKWMKADNNAATEEVRRPVGVALNGAALNQPVAVQTSGDITIGATLTNGVAYYLSDVAGGICPVADLTTGEYVCLIGIAKSATVLKLDINYVGTVL